MHLMQLDFAAHAIEARISLLPLVYPFSSLRACLHYCVALSPASITAVPLALPLHRCVASCPALIVALPLALRCRRPRAILWLQVALPSTRGHRASGHALCELAHGASMAAVDDRLGDIIDAVARDGDDSDQDVGVVVDRVVGLNSCYQPLLAGTRLSRAHAAMMRARKAAACAKPTAVAPRVQAPGAHSLAKQTSLAKASSKRQPSRV